MEPKHFLPMWLRYRVMELRGRGIYSHYADACKCVFIHIPKAAGTSVAQTLFGQGSRHVPWFEYQQANPAKFKRYFKFTFVRNPWDRLVSTYFFLKRGGLNEQDKAWAALHLSAFPDFESFVLGWLTPDAIDTWVHFRPQHYFVCNAEGRNMMDFTGRMENIDADFATVAARLGCTRQLTKVNVGSHKHYSFYYNDQTRERVQTVYARDIELFGYRFEQH